MLNTHIKSPVLTSCRTTFEIHEVQFSGEIFLMNFLFIYYLLTIQYLKIFILTYKNELSKCEIHINLLE